MNSKALAKVAFHTMMQEGLVSSYKTAVAQGDLNSFVERLRLLDLTFIASAPQVRIEDTEDKEHFISRFIEFSSNEAADRRFGERRRNP
jgi:hypothetical protein